MTSTPTVLRAAGGADFLAALPRLTGMRAPNSAHVVLFGPGPRSSRTMGAARVDLPTRDQLDDQVAAAIWAARVVEVASQVPGAEACVIVLDTEEELTERPAASRAGLTALLLQAAADGAGLVLRDLLAQGPDGWAEMLQGRKARLRPLAEIAASPLHDPDALLLSVDEWRAQHPGQTSEDPEEVRRIAARAGALAAAATASPAAPAQEES